jgi:hypothetical protein
MLKLLKNVLNFMYDSTIGELLNYLNQDKK